VGLVRASVDRSRETNGPFWIMVFVKVFISFDMEGVAGIVDWAQCRPPGQAYEEGRTLLLGEVNAAIDGAMAAGPRRSSATTRTGR